MIYYIIDLTGEKIVKVKASNSDEALRRYVRKVMHEIDPDFTEDDLSHAIEDFEGYVYDNTALESLD